MTFTELEAELVAADRGNQAEAVRVWERHVPQEPKRGVRRALEDLVDKFVAAMDRGAATTAIEQY